MILFYNAFVYLKVITAKRVQSSRTLDRRVGRQFTSWYVCLGARPRRVVWGNLRVVLSADRDKQTESEPRWESRRSSNVGSSGLIQKRVGPIIKGNSFVLAWHLKDRHLVSRQRHLCSRVPHSTRGRANSPTYLL